MRLKLRCVSYRGRGVFGVRSFRSGFAENIQSFIAFREASDVWNDIGYGTNIELFDHFCADHFPVGTPLCQEMVDMWC